MVKFTYLGLTAEEKKQRLEKQCSQLNPPEKRGQEPFYHIDSQRDNEELKEEKKKRWKKWMDEQRRTIATGLDAVDAKMSFIDPAFPGEDRPLVFEKNKTVSLPDDHPLVPKLRLLSVGVDQPKLHATHLMVKHEQFKMEIDKGEKPKDEKPVK